MECCWSHCDFLRVHWQIREIKCLMISCRVIGKEWRSHVWLQRCLHRLIRVRREEPDTRLQFQFKDRLSSYTVSHYKDITILRPSYLYNGNSYTGKITSELSNQLQASHGANTGFQLSRKLCHHSHLMILIVLDWCVYTAKQHSGHKHGARLLTRDISYETKLLTNKRLRFTCSWVLGFVFAICSSFIKTRSINLCSLFAAIMYSRSIYLLFCLFNTLRNTLFT